MKPKVRFLEVQPYGSQFLLSDPVGISPTLLVSRELLLVLSLMNGERDLKEVQTEFYRITGKLIGSEELRELVRSLDENYMLLNDRFLRRLSQEREKLLSSGVREPSHAGVAYPAEPEKLTAFIEGILVKNPHPEGVTGIIVPHMDLRVAGKVYGKVYGSLAGKSYDLVLILGVSHYYHETPFSVLPLDLKTPIGVIKTPKEELNRLRESFGYDLFQDVLAYTREHSIDFQTIFVKYLFPETPAVACIVSYGDEDFLKSVARKLYELVRNYRNPLIISSVDFSHVGRKFGDPASYDPSARDRAYIETLLRLEPEKGFKLLKSDENRTRIDGMYTNFVFLELLKLLGVKEGKLLDYEVYHEEPTDSKVSYAGILFTGS
ncbi:MAG: AmmeMemoRadiSam system protein B [Aquificae bacterium]|nr:AmmeMemoRadiSam system protein B [Aquificota bacterium]